MILHIVMFTFRFPWTWHAAEAQEAEIISKNHPQKIDEILGWSCARNLNNRTIAADFIIIGLFADHKSLETYQTHPDHIKGVEKWRRLANWTVADIDPEQSDPNFKELFKSLEAL